jgi:fluoroacetyl-CoA thioesterase
MPATGGSAVVTLVVADADTALAMGSGDVAVLATPRLIALCEEATVAASASRVDEGQTSVGTEVQLKHVAAIAVGSEVRAEASLERVEGRRLIFTVSVTDESGLVAAGKVTRVIVDRRAFMTKAR